MTPKDYIQKKAEEAAKTVSRLHGMDYSTALLITRSIWKEAQRCILRATSGEEWQRLSIGEKSWICRSVIKGLLDRERLTGFLSGDRKSIN